MPRKLKLWNGRAYCCHNPQDGNWRDVSPYSATIYAAAYSRADLRRLIEAYCGRDPGDREIKEFWSAGCWGRHMEGVNPERGLWLRANGPNSQPIRLA